jgi:hypothetical protein
VDLRKDQIETSKRECWEKERELGKRAAWRSRTRLAVDGEYTWIEVRIHPPPVETEIEDQGNWTHRQGKAGWGLWGPFLIREGDLILERNDIRLELERGDMILEGEWCFERKQEKSGQLIYMYNFLHFIIQIDKWIF